MLRELHIKNVAVIEEITVDFFSGFHVLTGETGAGKSILIDALGIVLGGRAPSDAVRTGADAYQRFAGIRTTRPENGRIHRRPDEQNDPRRKTGAVEPRFRGRSGRRRRRRRPGRSDPQRISQRNRRHGPRRDAKSAGDRRQGAADHRKRSGDRRPVGGFQAEEEPKVSAYRQAKQAFATKAFAATKPAQQFTVTKGKGPGYDVGDRVRHIKFGEGLVTQITEGGRDYEVTVDFDTAGTKKMFAMFAKLQKID